MRALRMFGRWWRRALRFAGPLVFLVAILALASRTLGPRGVGLPPSQIVMQVLGWTLPLLSSSLALGFVVMATIQSFKPQLRAAFHETEIRRWLRGESVDEFLHVVSPEAGDALLELPIEQLAAQIQAASDAALGIKSERSLRFLELCLGRANREAWRFTDEPGDRSVGYVIQRRLDDLQIQVRSRWRRLLRILSLIVGVFLTSFGAGIFGLWRQNLIGTAFLVLVSSLLAGFFASAARDVVAAIERLRS